MLPVVVLLLAALAQTVVLARDELRVVHAARVAAREAIVNPDEASARRAVQRSGVELDALNVTLRGGRNSGDLLTVVVSARPARLPLVGRAVSAVELRERIVVMVE